MNGSYKTWNTMSHKKTHHCIEKCCACETLYSKFCTYHSRDVECSVCKRWFFGTTCYANHLKRQGKSKFSVCERHHRCADCGAEYDPKETNLHKCGHFKCKTCGKHADFAHKCYMQPHRFPDEAISCEDEIEEATKWETASLARQQKSRYIVYDIETHVLDTGSGKGRLIPHLLVARTLCFNCMEHQNPTKRVPCTKCSGEHSYWECLSDEEWTETNHVMKEACWAPDDQECCKECGQVEVVIRAGEEEKLFSLFSEWLFAPARSGFTLVAHNGSGFDNPYLAKYIVRHMGLHVSPIYRGPTRLTNI